MDLASALAAPVQGRGSGQGARSASPGGTTDATAFGAVLSDVQGAGAPVQGQTPDGDAAMADGAMADGIPGNATSGATAQWADREADGGSTMALDPAAVPDGNAAALSAAPYLAASAQLAVGSEAGLPTPLTAVPGPLAKGSHELSGKPDGVTVTATPGPSGTPGLDPGIVVPAVPPSGTAQSAATQTAGWQPGQPLPAATFPAVTFPAAAVSAAALRAAGVPDGAVITTNLTAQQPAGAQTQALGPSSTYAAALATLAPGPGSGSAAGSTKGTGPVQTAAAAMAPTTSVAGPAVVAGPATTGTQLASAPVTGVATTGLGAGLPDKALAEVNNSGAVRFETTTAPAPASVPENALAVAGNAAAAAPASQPTSSVAAAPQPAAPAAPQPGATLQPQLARPLFTLAGAPQGQHIMTLQVTPEDLGPMTVRAHIDATGVRIELFAPADAGREAIRGILPELRKELADAGFGASLDVSEHSGPGTTAREGTSQDGASQDRAGRDSGSRPGNRNGPDDQRPGHRWEALADGPDLRDARILNGPQTTLDILV